MRMANTVELKNQISKILKSDMKGPSVIHAANGFGAKVQGNASLQKGARQLLRQFGS